jgi:hypothetical protein
VYFIVSGAEHDGQSGPGEMNWPSQNGSNQKYVRRNVKVFLLPIFMA